MRAVYSFIAEEQANPVCEWSVVEMCRVLEPPTGPQARRPRERKTPGRLTRAFLVELRGIEPLTLDRARYRRRSTPQAARRHQTEARRSLRELLTAAEKGEPIADGNLTAGDLIEDWRRKVLPARDLAVKTIVTYGWTCDRFVEVLGPKRARSLSADDVETALAKLATVRPNTDDPQQTLPALGRASLIKARSVLGQVLARAERRRFIARNVVAAGVMAGTSSTST